MHAAIAVAIDPAENETEFERLMNRDYRLASKWFGHMDFADFAAGYRAMEAWHAERPFPLIWSRPQ